MEQSSVVNSEKGIIRWISIIAVIVPVLVAILLFMPTKIDVASDWVYFLPHLNAVINSAATLALIAGVMFIKKGNIEYHRAAMTAAFGLGAIFLILGEEPMPGAH